MQARALTVGLLVVSLALAWVNGLVVRWLTVEFRLGDAASRGDHLIASGGCLATTLVLFVAMVAIAVFRPPRWLHVATAIGVGTQLALSITSYRAAQGLDTDVATGGTFGQGFGRAFLLPGSWPLLLVLVAAAVVGVRRASALSARSGD